MAHMTIRFRHNPATGEKELVIHHESDADALPHEHERDHRALAERLVGGPLGATGGTVDRVSPRPEGEGARPEETAARERAKERG
jgi:hypothetical protein